MCINFDNVTKPDLESRDSIIRSLQGHIVFLTEIGN